MYVHVHVHVEWRKRRSRSTFPEQSINMLKPMGKIPLSRCWEHLYNYIYFGDLPTKNTSIRVPWILIVHVLSQSQSLRQLPSEYSPLHVKISRENHSRPAHYSNWFRSVSLLSRAIVGLIGGAKGIQGWREDCPKFSVDWDFFFFFDWLPFHSWLG